MPLFCHVCVMLLCVGFKVIVLCFCCDGAAGWEGARKVKPTICPQTIVLHTRSCHDLRPSVDILLGENLSICFIVVTQMSTMFHSNNRQMFGLMLKSIHCPCLNRIEYYTDNDSQNINSYIYGSILLPSQENKNRSVSPYNMTNLML